MNNPTTKPEVYKALSQLTAVITGGKFARATKDLENDPCQRIEPVSYTHLTLPTNREV